jgi:hypothetical protein
MFDPKLIVSAKAAAAVVAALVMLVGVWPARKGRSGLATLLEVLAIGGGMVIGCWWLHVESRFPPIEDQDRLLLVLLPMTGVVEILAAGLGRRAWVGRVLRVLWALLVPALLLFGSGWLPATWTPGGDPTAASTWTPQQALAMLAGLGIALAVVWGLLIRAAERPGGFAVPAALGLVTAAAGVCIMLSGSASGGLIGLPFSGIAAGVLVICLLFARMRATTGLVGVGTVLLFGMLMGGRFFGELTTTNFALLLVAPLLCCLAAFAPLSRFKAVPRFVALLILCLLPAGAAAGLAHHKFAADTDISSAYSEEGAGGEAPKFGESSPGASSAGGTASTEPAVPQSTADKRTSPQDPAAEEPAPAASSGAKRGPAPIDPGEESKN